MIVIWWIGCVLLGGYTTGVELVSATSSTSTVSTFIQLTSRCIRLAQTPLIIAQPQVLLIALTLILVQIAYYGHKNPGSYWQRHNKTFSVTTCVIAFCIGLALAAAGQAALYFAISAIYRAGAETAITVIGFIPTVLIFSGYMPQLYEIYKYKRVLGVSLVFLLTDLSGATFNTISLVFHPVFDWPAAICFILIGLCDLTILSLWWPLELVWRKKNPEAWAKEKAGEDVVIVDEEVDEDKEKGMPITKVDSAIDVENVRAPEVVVAPGESDTPTTIAVPEASVVKL